MRRCLAAIIAIIAAAPGSTHAYCKYGWCRVFEAGTLVADGHFQLCEYNDNSIVGTITLSIPDQTVLAVSIHSWEEPFAVELPLPVKNLITVDIRDLSEERARCINHLCAYVRIVTVSHPEGLEGLIGSSQPVSRTTWSAIKLLYK